MVEKTKLSVKDVKSRTDDNEMDLSLMGIEIVPVKEIASVPKATGLDISCNQISVLADNFCSLLKHLVVLDLSKNQLQELPEDFGKMQKLQHLDLYKNKLRTLPVSFGQLKGLKWLDLKDNDLDEDLVNVVGDCLDDNQCKKCASNVVNAMSILASKLERERNNVIETMLKEKKEMERKKLLEQQRIAQIRKQQKKLEKEKRRKEWEAKQKAEEKCEPSFDPEEEEFLHESASQQQLPASPRGARSRLYLPILCTLVLLAAVSVRYYCRDPVDQLSPHDGKSPRGAVCEMADRNVAALDGAIDAFFGAVFDVLRDFADAYSRAFACVRRSAASGLDRAIRKLSDVRAGLA